MKAQEYYSLIRAYVEGRLSTDEFGMEFQKAFLAEPSSMDDELFLILNRLFWDWEAYYPDCTPKQETSFMISERTFRQTAVETKIALEMYLQERGLLAEERQHKFILQSETEKRIVPLMQLIDKYIRHKMPDFNIRINLLYSTPINLILQGFYFQPFYLDHPEAFTVWVFVQPLYVPADCIMLNYGARLDWLMHNERFRWLWGNEIQELEEPIFLEVLRCIQEVGIPFLKKLGTPADFVRNVRRTVLRRDDVHVQEAIAYSLVLTEKYAQALRALDRLNHLLQNEKEHRWKTVVAERVTQLRQRLVHNPQEAVELLHEWRNATLKSLGLSTA